MLLPTAQRVIFGNFKKKKRNNFFFSNRQSNISIMSQHILENSIIIYFGLN